MNLKTLVVAALAVSATPALAQEEAASPTVHDFTGPRIEGRIGYTEVRYEGEVDGEEGNTKEGAVPYGVEAGFDIPLGTAIVGGYAGIDFGTAETCSEVFGMDEACIAARRNITVGGRAGIPLGAALLFAKGGYSNTRFRASYEDFEEDEGRISASDSLDGFHIGGGFEIAAGPMAYIKAEYTYTMYDGGGGEVDGVEVSADVDRHQGLIGVGFRF